MTLTPEAISNSAHRHRGGIWALVAMGVLAAAVLWTGTTTSRGRPDATAASSAPMVATVAVTPFVMDSVASRLQPWSMLADSVERRLAGVPGIESELVRDPDDIRHRFTVSGELAYQRERIAVTVRVASREGRPVWTSTLWRGPDGLSDVAGTLASEIAAEILAQMAREAIERTSEER